MSLNYIRNFAILAGILAQGHATPTPASASQTNQSSSSPSAFNPGPGTSNSNVQSSDGIWPWQTYKSSPLTPPNITITTPSTDNKNSLSPGYTFITPKGFGTTSATKQQAGFILTPQNNLIYGIPDSRLDDLRVQTYKGKPHLTYFYNNLTNTGSAQGSGYGSLRILDSSYTLVHDVCVDLGLNTLQQPRPACQFDIHEQLITSRDTLLVTGYNYTTANLSSVGGPANGFITDSHVFEIDIESKKTLFHWKASDHVPFSASHLAFSANSNGSAARPWDWFHVNSIELVGEDYLINSRNTWSTFLVSGKDGSVIWTLNGATGGDFGSLPSEANFSWQHYARAHNVSDSSFTISYFANNNAVGSNSSTPIPTRGLVLQLALPPNKDQSPKLLRKLERADEQLYVGSQGSYEVSVGPQGNQFVGYGQIAVMREYGPGSDGSDLRWEGRFGADNEVVNYRAYKQEWCGTPAGWDPALVLAKEDSGKEAGFVSWNGATDVLGWDVWVGESEGNLRSAGRVPVRGFETRFEVPEEGCVQVEAVMEGAGRKSNVVCR